MKKPQKKINTIPKNGQYRIIIEHRITNLEVSIDDIRNNHLPHIEAKVDRLTWFIGSGLVGIISILVKLLIK